MSSGPVALPFIILLMPSPTSSAVIGSTVRSADAETLRYSFLKNIRFSVEKNGASRKSWWSLISPNLANFLELSGARRYQRQ
jgi:hypothetical protein